MRIDDEPRTAGNGDEILAAQATARLFGRHLLPSHHIVAVRDRKFRARLGNGTIEPVAFDQHRRLAIAEVREGAVAAIAKHLGALIAKLVVDIDGLVEIERIQNALARHDIFAALVSHLFASAEQSHPVALHRGGFAHRDAGIDL